MTRPRRNAIIAALLLVNVILVGIAAYEVTLNRQLSSQNAAAQQVALSLQQQIAMQKSTISTLTAQNSNELATIQALSLASNSIARQIELVNTYLNMQNVTTLVANKTITIWPVQSGTPYSAPHYTSILNFTAEYAGYLIIRSNVTTDAFVQVQILFPVCNQHTAICQTTFSPTINGYLPPLIPVLPGQVIIMVGSNAPISPQHAWVSVQYTS
jgi:hypothetical protein